MRIIALHLVEIMSCNKKARVLFLNRSYWPDTEATGQLLTELCEGLADEFDVHVLAGKPNALTADCQWEDVRERNGVTIHRVTHSRFPKSSLFLKGLNFLSFAAACRRQILRLPVPDVVVFETDPFLLPFVADRLCTKTGCTMIGYLQDIYPDVAIALGKISNRLWVKNLRRRMIEIYKRCGEMIVLSDDMKSLLLDAGLSKDRISIIPNWANTEEISPVANEENVFIRDHKLHNKFVVMYSGNLGLTQRLEEFVEAASLLRGDADIQFVFVGRGANRRKLQQQVQSLGLSNVLFLDYQPKEKLAHSLSAGNLHLVPLTRELSRCLMPSKLYGILAAGRAYMTNAPEESELHRITTECQVGLTVKAGVPAEIANQIKAVKNNMASLTEMGIRGRALAEARFTRKHATAAFKNALLETLNRHEETLAC